MRGPTRADTRRGVALSWWCVRLLVTAMPGSIRRVRHRPDQAFAPAERAALPAQRATPPTELAYPASAVYHPTQYAGRPVGLREYLLESSRLV
jgi:hypothetical protein